MINYNKIKKKEEKRQKEIDDLKHQIISLEKKVLILEELKHDIGRFANLVLTASENLNHLIVNDFKKDMVEEAASTILHTTSMISPRIIYSDMELSNGQMQSGAKLNSGVYKKFDKSKRILRRLAGQRSVKINFHNPSQHTIQALNSFDMVPFIILENAVKYSPTGGEVNVTFDENNKGSSMSKLEVTISSIGPYLDSTEIGKITQRGFRSKSSKVRSTSGQGLGLYIAENICLFHEIKISFESNYQLDIDNIKYGTFTAKLNFK
jgi:signal transduction histidine kinase